MTKEEVLKKFEELGYEIEIFHYKIQMLKEIIIDEINDTYTKFLKKIIVFTNAREYLTNWTFTLQEHQLLTELFKCEGWI